jgi:hypothetical protein
MRQAYGGRAHEGDYAVAITPLELCSGVCSMGQCETHERRAKEDHVVVCRR